MCCTATRNTYVLYKKNENKRTLMYACYGSYTATPTTIRFKSEKLKTPYKMLATPIHLNLHRSCTQPRPPNYPRTQTAPKE